MLGAGVMGSQIAAHLSSAGLAVDLFDVEDRAKAALVELPKRKPPAFASLSDAARVRPMRLETDLDQLAVADWILEAVVEDLHVKRDLFEKVDRHRRAGGIVSTNTSGISIRAIAEGRSEDFRRSFLGTHFFNPPRAMHLLEVIPLPETEEDLVRWAIGYGERSLGKGVILAADTPLFIANRIGIFVRMSTIWGMLEEGFSIEEVDAICGEALGRPKTGVFRLGDLVGLDTTANVGRYLYEAAPNDERREVFRMPPFLQKLLDAGSLGDKTGGGYYRRPSKDKKGEILVLDWRTGEYRPRAPVELPVLEEALAIPDLAQRLCFLTASDDRVGRFVWRILRDSFAYAARRVGEITDRPADIDRAQRWGFAWRMGLFEIWDGLGVREVAARMEKEGVEPPPLARELLSRGRERFYDPDADPPTCVVAPGCRPAPIEEGPPRIDLARIRRRKGRLDGNDDASLVDVGDGVCVLEFHSKMNTLGPGVAEMLDRALERIGRDVRALVIGNSSTHFSAGANLRRLLDLAQRGEWKQLDRRLQSACVRMGRSGQPIVAAPAGLALGGGAEIVLRAPLVQAHDDLQMGLVELRVGLIPGAGGAAEMLRRAMESPIASVDPFAALKRTFDGIRSSRVSTSAKEAMELGYLRSGDQITANRRFLLDDGKAAALRLADSSIAIPVPDEEILCLGADALARLRLDLHLAREAGEATEYDVVVAGELARVLCGGDLFAPRKVPEQYLLDLERESFLRLLGDPRTQARIASLLETGQPVRN